MKRDGKVTASVFAYVPEIYQNKQKRRFLTYIRKKRKKLELYFVKMKKRKPTWTIFGQICFVRSQEAPWTKTENLTLWNRQNPKNSTKNWTKKKTEAKGEEEARGIENAQEAFGERKEERGEEDQCDIEVNSSKPQSQC